VGGDGGLLEVVWWLWEEGLGEVVFKMAEFRTFLSPDFPRTPVEVLGLSSTGRHHYVWAKGHGEI